MPILRCNNCKKKLFVLFSLLIFLKLTFQQNDRYDKKGIIRKI